MKQFNWLRSPSQLVGQRVENKAEKFLRQQGLKQIERNYRCRAGEIDLVMREDQVLVFVEVRFRRQASFGSSAESVNLRKQKKIIKAAQHFLKNWSEKEWPACRFDVIAVNPANKNETSLQFDWIKNAFDLQ